MQKLNFKERFHLLGPIFLMIGIFNLIILIDRTLYFGPPLTSVGVSTVSVAGERAFGGSWLLIEVDGERYRCAGAQRLTGWRGIEVLYQPENPARCREASIVESRPSRSEWIALAISLQFLVLGVLSLRGLMLSSRRKREARARLLQELE